MSNQNQLLTEQNCPSCQAKFTLPSLSVPMLLPPTGGDYEWVQSMVDLNCPHCSEYLQVEVRQALTGEILNIGELGLGNNPKWSIYNLSFSEDGQFLAMNSYNGMKIYQKQSLEWVKVFQRKKYQFTCWDENKLLAYSAKDDYSDRTYQAWQMPDLTKLWKSKLKLWSSVEAEAFNLEKGIFVRGGEIDPIKDERHLQVINFNRDKKKQIRTLKLSSGLSSRFYLNLKKSQALCVQTGFESSKNLIQLWQLNSKNTKFKQLAEYSLGYSQVAWATWRSDGNILLVECHNKEGLVSYENMPYGLVCLDGRNLSVLQSTPQVDIRVCPSYTDLKWCQVLSTGELLWVTDRLYILDAETWEYRATLPYPQTALDSFEPVAVDSKRETIAIAQQNDVIVYDCNSQQGRSLRYQSLIKQ